MIKTLLASIIIFISCHYSLGAQQSLTALDSKSPTSLEGILRDQNLDEVIPFGKVALYQNEQLIKGEDTDMGGHYSFNNITPGQYQLKASFYGYDFVDITEIQITEGTNEIVDLDLKVQEDLYAPISIVGAKVKTHKHVIVCYGTIRAKELRPHQDKTNVLETDSSDDITSRSNPNIFKRDPRDSPSELELLLYPNPTTGIINIDQEFESLQIQLINPLGQVLGLIEYRELENDQIQIDLSNYPAGTYFMQLKHDQGTQVEKVVVIHL